ncbi:hypothetical protein GDO78_000194 [Eleutherodactylus coqui]|uniref:Coiled-coil domain-containing protein 89 n=1 Tax=Eleutherodactylus coqui TaxID=57060 RepID=A0A8J6FRM0_ELECQ|nr:hypothetical protein GDO78_000194 [Eleutherodactylus coqui]
MPGGSGDVPVRSVSSSVWDETTEMALLRSRLDEQSQLICLLKRRADDTELRCRELEAEQRGLEGLLGAERRRAAQLEDRFGLLADNHRDMIRFKDEYKRHNEELRAECERLREGAYPELREKERSVRELQEQLEAARSEQQGAQERLEGARAEHQGALEELRGQIETSSGEILTLTRGLQLSEETCRHLQGKLSHLEEVQITAQKEAEKKMAELNKEKEDLLQLCMERGRSLQERQREATDVTHRLQSAEKARREAEERYQRDITAVDADARIVELNARLADSDKEMAQLKREFEAYKKHSSELLAKERELNAKLRHLIG